MKLSTIDKVIGQNGQNVVRYIHRGCGRRRSKGKWMVVPLYHPPFLQRCGITTHKDLQEVARSALVKKIKLNVAALIC
jgi:hypothetical protein